MTGLTFRVGIGHQIMIEEVIITLLFRVGIVFTNLQ